MNVPALLRAAALSASTLLATAAWANPQPPRLASLTIENDFFAGYDRHYTNGIQAAFLVDKSSLPGFAHAFGPLRDGHERDIVIAIGQRIYTPTDIETPDPDPSDRPYGGWLYVMADVKRASGNTIDHYTASLGIVGPAALARHTHRAAHDLYGGDRPMGWHHQLRNEVTVLLGYERAWPAVLAGHHGGNRFDLSLRVGGALGNAFTYANAGAVLRYGRNLPNDLPVTHISLGPPRDGYRGAAEPGWYVWAGVDARAVARNIFLDGNTFKDSASVDREPFGHDWQVGFALAWPHARVGFTFIERSREFEGQQGPDRFGQLALSVSY